MKRTLLLPLAATVLFAAVTTVSQAKDDVMPPPTTIHKGESATGTVSGETAPNLNEDLSAPEAVEGGAEVRAYTREDGAEVTEHSINGQVYMVRVQPAGGFPAYYLYDNDGDGVFERRLPGDYKRPSPPMWVIKKF
ncbi:MAG: DUF2782 domain-containing protein [Mariprofundaceae bacterium]|nr:DUF2782 domain-containing protein [Mariprofundaceae bacterium]